MVLSPNPFLSPDDGAQPQSFSVTRRWCSAPILFCHQTMVLSANPFLSPDDGVQRQSFSVTRRWCSAPILFCHQTMVVSPKETLPPTMDLWPRPAPLCTSTLPTDVPPMPPLLQTTLTHTTTPTSASIPRTSVWTAPHHRGHKLLMTHTSTCQGEDRPLMGLMKTWKRGLPNRLPSQLTTLMKTWKRANRWHVQLPAIGLTLICKGQVQLQSVSPTLICKGHVQLPSVSPTLICK